MARHNEILTQFKDIISEFDFSNKAHKNLLSMILIKVSDISNEARPMNVAEPWLDRLLMVWIVNDTVGIYFFLNLFRHRTFLTFEILLPI